MSKGFTEDSGEGRSLWKTASWRLDGGSAERTRSTSPRELGPTSTTERSGSLPAPAWRRKARFSVFRRTLFPAPMGAMPRSTQELCTEELCEKGMALPSKLRSTREPALQGEAGRTGTNPQAPSSGAAALGAGPPAGMSPGSAAQTPSRGSPGHSWQLASPQPETSFTSSPRWRLRRRTASPWSPCSPKSVQVSQQNDSPHTHAPPSAMAFTPSAAEASWRHSRELKASTLASAARDPMPPSPSGESETAILRGSLGLRELRAAWSLAKGRGSLGGMERKKGAWRRSPASRNSPSTARQRPWKIWAFRDG
ncbi:MAG: hypothetical protein LBQ79_08435 [Deltaproteobacteria bacterium]|nr:hypothetical protein [Deltaproteobacteria bacterium]